MPVNIYKVLEKPKVIRDVMLRDELGRILAQKVPYRTEQCLQIDVNTLFEIIFIGQLVEFHAVPNGGSRSKKTAGLLKMEGVKSGVGDWALTYNRQAYAIELKRPKHYQQPIQKKWQAKFVAAGGVYTVAKSITEVLQTLIDWGIPFDLMGLKLPAGVKPKEGAI